VSDWKRFQDRVAELEPLVNQVGFTLQSPAWLPDKDTGQRREIDVLVRRPYAGREILVMLECRRRTKTPDVTWIEQLDAKRDSVGANHVVAISSTGFTDPARKKARRLNIELRTLSEVTAESLLEDVYSLTLIFSKRNSLNARFEVVCGPIWRDHVTRHPEDASLNKEEAPLPPMPPTLADAGGDPKMKNFYDTTLGKPVSAWEICAGDWRRLFEDLSPGEPPQHRSMTVVVPGDPPSIHCVGDPEWFVLEVQVEADVWLDAVNMTPSGSFRYEDEDHVLVKRLEYDLSSAGDEGILALDMYPPRPDGLMPCLPRVFQRSPGLPTIELRRT